jgi:hypothetical protein
MKILTILLFWYPKVSKIPISVLWLTILIYDVVIKEKKLINKTNTNKILRIFFRRFCIFYIVCLDSE